ncbi:cell division protein FtsX [Paracoccus albicereus]|uniref:cell division protein FtsX n=1 Tax=Paracoccus albicereus TaxID=2922394 RepID=UPI003F770B22
MKRPDFKGATFKGLDIRALAQGVLRRDGGIAARIVPPTGFTAQLTLFSAGALAFLAVFALALSLAAGRMADRWSESLAGQITLRVSAPTGQAEAQTAAALEILRTTPGLGEAHVVPDAEVAALLEPWFGPDVPVDALPVPRLIEVPIASSEFDAEGLRMRLEGEQPNTVLDDHGEWRRPLVSAANRLRGLGMLSLVLIAASSGAMLTLAAKAALAANGQVIRVLRLVGARDITIAGAFVRRFTGRAALGAAVGAILGMIAIAILPDMDSAGTFLTGLGFQGWGWFAPLLIPLIAAIIGFAATRWAALRMLREVR